MDKNLTISEAAARLGVSPDTIRRWEKKGLIKSSRNEHGHRLFKFDEIKRIHNKVSGNHNTNNYKILKSKKRLNYTAIDLFAGAGGTALGLENAGLNHIMLNEINKDAVATLLTNRPNWEVAHSDIADIDFKKYKGNVDVIEGGFPCQAFSYAGRKLGFEDTRGTLFYEFARAVKEARPKVAIGENVRGLLNHDGGKTLEAMVSVLQELGYRVAFKVLRAQYLDVPQKRERLLIFAVRNDHGDILIYPKEKDYTVSLKEAIGDRPRSRGQEYSEWKKKILARVPPGGYWRDLPIEIQKEYMKTSFYLGGGKTGMARRLSWDEPSLTLTCNPGQKQTERCHPEETRPLNVREYARIQTFPDKWQFVGSTSSQYKQIGNAVPVNLGYHMGLAAISMLNGEFDTSTQEQVRPMDNNLETQIEFLPRYAYS
jgi:DNA (cytosine-5)-methyltransferase 1